MNTKTIGSLFIGLVAGVAIGAAACYKHFEHQFELKLDQEMAEYREYYHKKDRMRKAKALNDGVDEDKYDASEKATEDATGAFKEGVGFIPKEVLDAADAMLKGPAAAERVQEKTQYNKIRDEYNTGAFEKKRPYMISEEAFERNTELIETQVFYNMEEGTVYDQDGNEVEDVGNVLGFKNLEALSEEGVTSIYIRNDDLGTIFCVDLDS